MSREEELEARIDYYKNIELFGVGLTTEEEADLHKAEVEYSIVLAYKQKEKEADAKVVTRRVKQAQWRGKNCERQCAKDTDGVVVGRSKGVQLKEDNLGHFLWVQVNCQQPPDVLAPPFFSFECKNTKFPKSVAKAVSQAIANAPEGFVGYVYWYDSESRCTYIITTRKNFLDMHFKGG